MRSNKRVGARFARITMLTAMCVLGLSALSLSIFAVELQTHVSAAVTDSIVTSTFSTVQDRVAPPTAASSQTRNENQPTRTPQDDRVASACNAARRGEVEAIPALIAMLGNDSEAQVVRCWDTSRWSPALQTFKHPSPGEQAALALASFGRPAFAPLSNQLDNSNAVVRRNAAWAIGELTNMPPGERDGAVPRLIALLTDPDGWVRMASARALGELRNPSAAPALVANLVDSDVHVRELAIWALSELKDKSAVRALCHVLLSDLAADVRRGAAEALGEIRDAEALPFLKQALNDPAVRAKAQWAISEIEG